MPKSADNEESAPSFEAALEELREIVSALEGGELGLEESLARFEQGTKLLRTCFTTLEQAEQKIEILTRIADDGTLETEDFDSTATAEKESKKRAKHSEASPTDDGESGGALF